MTYLFLQQYWWFLVSLLGGLLVQVDDRVIDGSLKHRLHEIKEVMNR